MTFTHACILLCKFYWNTKGLGGKQKFPAGRQAVFYGIHLQAQYLRGFGGHLKCRKG